MSVGKRSSGQFERRRQDAYDTPPDAILPLIPHLKPDSYFIEPCGGAGKLQQILQQNHGLMCLDSFDIEPRGDDVGKGDATKFDLQRHMKKEGLCDAPWPDYFITNPPWSRTILHAIILNLYWQLPTWLLFDADWIHTAQAGPYLPMLRKIVSVGRVRWIEGSEHVGKDNAAWMLFAPPAERAQFYGRGT